MLLYLLFLLFILFRSVFFLCNSQFLAIIDPYVRISLIIKGTSGVSGSFEVRTQRLQEHVFADSAGVAYQNAQALCSGYCDVHALFVGEETYLALRVRPHHRYDDDFFFATLEPVHRCDFHLGEGHFTLNLTLACFLSLFT